MYKEQLEIAKSTSEIWANVLEHFKKWFHLRINSGNITIVSTHKDRPMRGIPIAKTKLGKAISDIGTAIDGDKIDWEAIVKFGYNKVDGKVVGFEAGDKNGCNEYPDQAEIINLIRKGDKKLLEVLNLSELHFIASELVLFRKGDQKRERIDIVAHNGKEIIFFEVKSQTGI